MTYQNNFFCTFMDYNVYSIKRVLNFKKMNYVYDYYVVK